MITFALILQRSSKAVSTPIPRSKPEHDPKMLGQGHDVGVVRNSESQARLRIQLKPAQQADAQTDPGLELKRAAYVVVGFVFPLFAIAEENPEPRTVGIPKSKRKTTL